MFVTMLTYRGEGAYRPELPARDLDRSDIEELARRREISVDDVVAEAVGSGLYVATETDDDVEPVSAGNVVELPAPTPPADPIEDPRTTRAELAAIATDLGLEVDRKATKAQITELIRTEQQRLADQDAAAVGSGASEPTPPADPIEATPEA